MIKDNSGQAAATVEDISSEGEEFAIEELEQVAGGCANSSDTTKKVVNGQVKYD